MIRHMRRQREGAGTMHGLDGIGHEIHQRLPELIREYQYGCIACIGFVDHDVFHFHGGLCRGQRLVQYLLQIRRHLLVEGLTVGYAGKISNDRRHATAMSYDVSGATLDMLQVLFILNDFSQSDDPEQRVVEFMADAGGEYTQASDLFRLNQLVLQSALVRRVSKHQSDTVFLSWSRG